VVLLLLSTNVAPQNNTLASKLTRVTDKVLATVAPICVTGGAKRTCIFASTLVGIAVPLLKVGLHDTLSGDIVQVLKLCSFVVQSPGGQNTN
jgi:hypothetical protein